MRSAIYYLFKKASERNDTRIGPTFRTPVLTLFADQIRSSQLKSLRFKKKIRSRSALRQKLDLAVCTIIVAAGLGSAFYLVCILPGTGTRYQVPIMYSKTYYTVNTIIFSLASDSEA